MMKLTYKIGCAKSGKLANGVSIPSGIEEASLQSRSLEYALSIIVQCLSQACTYLEDLSCGLIAHLHVLLDQHHCQLWYQNGIDIVD